VTGGEEKAVPVGPLRVGGVMPEVTVPEDVSHGSGPQADPRMAGVSLLNSVGGEKADGVDAFSVYFYLVVGHTQFTPSVVVLDADILYFGSSIKILIVLSCHKPDGCGN